MSFFKQDWEFISDTKYNNIRDSNFTIIYSNVDDYSTAKMIYRSREMYDLMEKLLLSRKAGEPLEPILEQMQELKNEIDKR